MKENQLQFPIKFKFNVATMANDFTAKDANDQTIAYVRQKMFKMKEDILIYNNESKEKVNYNIKADKWIDFSAAYSFTDDQGQELGKVARKGWASIWNAKYEIIDENREQKFMIREENAWVKVFDSLLGEIPVLSFFTGYLFNPTYKVMDKGGETVVRLKKEPSFFGRKFEIEKVKDMNEDSEKIILSLMMMILLERRRG
ncbi:hypothetical protein [Aureivirga sp. CE67]|uniref:hypothetical protein n=1 Tax=Aureivirga sp. CE67 TaxID=1788983 RepID=UPI0018CA7CE3|nr:hypothetical protein [Aureivirga sp. CE67]